MRIPCPFCGDRDQQEFVYRGDAAPRRPVPEAGEAAFAAYVYERSNFAGAMTEHWYHAYGCRRWLVVTRNTRTHELTEAVFAGPMS
jgi:sarcosine oxidase subunit delta